MKYLAKIFLINNRTVKFFINAKNIKEADSYLRKKVINEYGYGVIEKTSVESYIDNQLNLI